MKHKARMYVALTYLACGYAAIILAPGIWALLALIVTCVGFFALTYWAFGIFTR